MCVDRRPRATCPDTTPEYTPASVRCRRRSDAAHCGFLRVENRPGRPSNAGMPLQQSVRDRRPGGTRVRVVGGFSVDLTSGRAMIARFGNRWASTEGIPH